MAFSELWTVEMLFAAFAGGAFGAAIGALPSFSLAGVMVVVGELHTITLRSIGAEPSQLDITSSIAFGVVLGPHIAFGGGAAAVAYAARRGYLDTTFEYHEAKHVTRGLGSKPDVLLVGGVFGVLGYWIATVSTTVAIPTDPIALGVVLSALVHRVVFGYSLIGSGFHGLLDMSPFETGQRRAANATGRSDGGQRRWVVEPWLPYQYRWRNVVTVGFVVGILGAYIAYVTASAFLAFGVSVIALGFMCAGVDEIPVTHHMSLPASTIVLASVESSSGPVTPAAVSQTLSLGDALVLGAIFGVVGALLGEFAQRVFYAHADTHLDPPAASIVGTSSLICLLVLLGILPNPVYVPLP
jgi:hypothetical protein